MESATASIIQDPRFDSEDFLVRWKRARVSALKPFVVGGTEAIGEIQEAEEEVLLARILARLKDTDGDLILRRVFDQSRKFGLSASKFLGLTFEISDLREILGKSEISCFGGVWRSHNEAFVHERTGCSSFKDLGSFGCDYWREALDGLVMGVGENERLARHKSLGHGDSTCVDILFTEAFATPRVVHADSVVIPSQPKYGALPTEVMEQFQPVFAKFRQMKIELIIAGISEGTLYYRLDPEKGVLCGAGGKLMHDTFLRDTKKLFPNLKVADVAPLAVYGGST